ncbi:hypothetical protein E0Z10_g9537 [Xylaria hypoxylon]|uniref:non-specific serine/threonine protein kinase n=1 Tax=Xylaria hypoxylon TaxID=37992 RepID=A0A4Z0YKR1_9PEZI|nr:hypothetical protein E0Z10_g9537 [Xylaria hypoxylon]
MVLDDYDTQRLPYIQEREIGTGGFGTVSKVEIPYGHLVIRTGGETSFPKGSRVVARKDYRVKNHAREDFENERDLCKAILGSPNQCDNVMLSYGTIEYSSGSGFSLFMPKADYDLFEYMRHHESDNSRSIESIARHMTCAAGLARGVAHLHNGIESPSRGTLVYHMDLKPQNVLIFHKDGEMIWKISDFGLSRIKTLHDGSSVNGTRDLTVSPTQNLAGQGIYLAPESGSGSRMTRKSDVWSLGCIVSVLCVWLQKGSNGVRKYATSRGTENINNSASFYSPTIFGGVKSNPQIKQWHKVLISDERDVVIREVLKDILGYLEDKTFLINASRRPEASELKKRLEIAAIKGLRRAEQQETHNQRSVDHLINKFTSIIKPHR